VQLGRAEIMSAVDYFGIDVDHAIETAEQTEA